MGLRQSFVAEQYVASLYWSVTTMATIGYGDISPTTTGERVFGLFAMVTATFLFNYGITTVVTLVANTNRAVVEFKCTLVNARLVGSLKTHLDVAGVAYRLVRARLLLQAYLLYGPLFIGIPITIVLLFIPTTPTCSSPPHVTSKNGLYQ